jgi:hypothetical protein
VVAAIAAGVPDIVSQMTDKNAKQQNNLLKFFMSPSFGK